MDVVRRTRRPLAFRYAPQAAVLAALCALAVITLPWLSRRSPALPIVDRGSLVLDTALRGTLIRAVQASGQLVPDRVQVVATTADGIVDGLPIRAGSRVDAGELQVAI